jgi:predicted phosphodiesterase
MRVAILSDVHGNIRALEACLEDLEREGGADVIVGAGDFCMDGPKPRRVLETLQEIGARCVRGNTERYIAMESIDLFDEEGRDSILWQRDQVGETWLAWMRALPFSMTFGEGRDRLFISHANPKTDDEHVWPDADDATLEKFFGDVDASAFAFGHLHLPYTRAWRGKLLVNVSSAGLPKDGDPRAHYAILTQRSGGWQVRSRRVDFDVEKAMRDLDKSGIPHLAKRRKVLDRHRYKELGAIVP